MYSENEDIKFEAVITNYEIKGDEKIRLKISGNKYDSSFYLSKIRGKFYSGEINIPVKGDYEFTAELFSGNTSEQTLKGRFTIDENNYEFKNTRSDNTFLSMLSNDTKGYNLSNKESREIKDLFNEMNSKSINEFKARSNFEFDINPYYLTILIFLLCLEWFLRKRNNLP